MASETWRHELQPLGVRTITLVTCAVKTNFFGDYHGAEVPETSNYADIRDFIHNLTDGRLQANAISSRQYAIKVVREVEKGTVGTVWAGTDALSARLASWMLPQSLLVSLESSRVLDTYLIKTAGHDSKECCSCFQRDG